MLVVDGAERQVVLLGDLGVRLGLYRRIAGLVDAAEIEAFAAEMVDRFGPLPVEVENLLQIIAIKRLCREAGVEKVDAGPKGAVFAFHQNRFARPEKLVEFINRKRDAITLKPDQRVVYRDDWTTPKARIVGVRKLMEQIARLAA